jgi:hypothetical protein
MTIIILTSASSSPLNRPDDWIDLGHTVEGVGCGGNGAAGSTGVSGRGGGGGGGGVYCRLTYSSGNLGTTTSFQVIASNSSTSSSTTNATYWEGTTNTNSYGFQAGQAGSTTTHGVAGGSTVLNGSPSPVTYTGQAAANVGGNGGDSDTGAISGGGGGGAAGGPTGNGQIGGSTSGTIAGGGGSGGAGANGNLNTGGTGSTTTSGANGGNGTSGSGFGTGTAALTGTQTAGTGGSATIGGGGGGGAGGTTTTASMVKTGGSGGTLGNVTNWRDNAGTSYGVGGGGGGGGGSSGNVTVTANGGPGANYGGGGGGAGGARGTSSTINGGTAGGGILVVTYTSAWGGYSAQDPQPPSSVVGALRGRSGSIARGDDGIVSKFWPWKPECSVQPPQPPRPRSLATGAIMQGDAGIYAPMPAVQAPALGFEQTQPAARGGWTGRRWGIEGRSEFASFSSLPSGWEIQYVDLPHRWFKSPETGDQGTEAPYTFTRNAGSEVQYQDLPHRIFKSPTDGDRGIQAKFTFSPNTAWGQPADLRRWAPKPPLDVGDGGFEAPRQATTFGYDPGQQIQLKRASRITDGGDPGILARFIQGVTPPDFQPTVPRRTPRIVDSDNRGPVLPTIAPATATNGWMMQPADLRRPPPTYAALKGRSEAVGNTWVNAGWDVQYQDLLRPRRLRATVGDAGIQKPLAPAAATPAWGFEPASATTRGRWPGRVYGIEGRSEFVAFSSLPMGWEIQYQDIPHRWFKSPETGDAGTSAPYTFTRPAGFDAQSQQPPHPRPERAAATLTGDTGTQAQYIPQRPAWGWEVAPALSYREPWNRAASGMRGDDGTQAVKTNWLNAGWEKQATDVRRPAFKLTQAGDDGIAYPLVTVTFGFEAVQHLAPRRPKLVDRADDAGIAFPFSATRPPPDFQSLTSRRTPRTVDSDNRGPVQPFSLWVNDGWEVQPPQPPHPAPEKRFAGLARGDDGVSAPFTFSPNYGWQPQPSDILHRIYRSPTDGDRGIYAVFSATIPISGWDVQVVQPPQPRWKRAGAGMIGDAGNEAPFSYWRNAGWQFQHLDARHPLWRRPDAGDRGISAVFVPPSSAPAWGFSTPDSLARPRRNLAGGIHHRSGFVGSAVASWGFETVQVMMRARWSGRGYGIEGRSDFASFSSLTWGWDVQYQDVAHRFRKSPDAGDPGTQAPYVFNVVPYWWEVPAFQPPHPRPERAASWLAGDAGTEAKFIPPAAVAWGWDVLPQGLRQKISRWSATRGRSEAVGTVWLNFGWEVQAWQPPHPRPERAASWLVGDNGILSPFTPTRPAWGWDVAPAIAYRKPWNRAAAWMRWSDGITRPFTFAPSFGWPVQSWQPPHRAPEWRANFLRGDDGTAAPFSFWRNDGWPVQPFQPGHPRPERAGAIMVGDPGNENTYTFFIAPVIPGWEVAPALAYHLRRERAGAIMRGEDGTEATFQAWLNAGAEVQPWQPPHPRPERAGAIMRGIDGNERPFTFSPPYGWPIQPWQPPHSRPERGGWLTGEPGIEAPYNPFATQSWEVAPPVTYRKPWNRAAGPMRGDDGNAAPFTFSRPDGWEVQPWQPPHRSPEQKFAASAKGDDGIEAKFTFTRPMGWPIQEWQPPHPRPERAGAVMRGDDGTENTFSFHPVTYAPFPWDVTLQPPYMRWGRGVMILPVGLDVKFTPIPKPTTSACIIYGCATLPIIDGCGTLPVFDGRAARPILDGDACGCDE